MFAKYDTGGKGGLNWDDIQDMVYANMNVRAHLQHVCPAAYLLRLLQVNDFVGWIAGSCVLQACGISPASDGLCSFLRPIRVVGLVAGCSRREGIPVQREGAKPGRKDEPQLC
jgi:hypothetical protein